MAAKRKSNRTPKRCKHVSRKLVGFECLTRSKLEYDYMQLLDSNDCIAAYVYEPFGIPYRVGKRTRVYWPDVAVLTKAGKLYIVEIKPTSRLKKVGVIKKSKFAEAWCRWNNAVYIFATDGMIAKNECGIRDGLRRV